MAEKKFDAQVNYGWGLSLNMTGKAPAVAKRIFDTYADALAYANDVNDSAIEGLVLSVVADTDATKNGAYFVQQAASAAVEADEEKGIEAVDAKEAILVKLGSADAAAGDTADALQAAKDYADAKVKALADGAVSANTDAIDVLNGDAQTDGSVKKAVADEKALREAAEKNITDRLDVIEGEAEGSVKKALADAKDYADNKVADLDATVSGASAHVSVEIVEEDGKLTTVTVVENNIASADDLANEVSGLTKAINDEADRALEAEAELAGRIKAIEDAPYATEADVTTEANRAKAAETANADAIAAEKTRAEGKEGELATAISTEKTRAEGAESTLSGRIDVIEGEGEGSVKKALADAKAYADTKIDGLNSTKTGEGTFVDVTVAQENGVITSVTVTESDIANAQDLADEVSARTAADAAINEKIGKVTEGKTVVDMIADAQTAASDVDAKVDTLIGDDANMSARAIVQDEVLKQLESENISDSFDTLKEMAEYLSSHPQSVTEMNTAINNNAKAITDETAAREAAVQGVQDAVDAIEADYLKAADKTELNNAITAETAARVAADQAINNKIGEVETGKTLVEMIEAAEAAAIAAATVVAEDSKFVTIEQTGEVGKTQTYTIKTQDIASASATTESIAAETKARTDADAALDGRLNVIEGEGEGSIKKAVADEKARAEAAENGLTAAIAAETAAREAAVQGVQDAVDAIEADYLKAADKTELNNAITAEKERAEDAESGLTAAIEAEIDRAEGAEEALDGRLDVLEGVTVTGKDAIVVSESDAKKNKEVSLKLGTQPAEGEAGIVLSQDANGLVAKLQWGTF